MFNFFDEKETRQQAKNKRMKAKDADGTRKRRKEDADERRYFKRLKKSVERAENVPAPYSGQITPPIHFTNNDSVVDRHEEENDHVLSKDVLSMDQINERLIPVIETIVDKYSVDKKVHDASHIQWKKQTVHRTVRLIHTLLSASIDKQCTIASKFTNGQRVATVDPYQVSTRTIKSVIHSMMMASASSPSELQDRTALQEERTITGDEESEEDKGNTGEKQFSSIDSEPGAEEDDGDDDNGEEGIEDEESEDGTVHLRDGESFVIPQQVLDNTLNRLRNIRNANRSNGNQCFYHARRTVNRVYRFS